MSSYTDLVLILAFLFFFWRGWSLGIFRCLIGPFILIIVFFICVIYIDLTGDLPQGIFYIIVSTFIASTTVNLLLSFIKRSHTPGYRPFVFIGTRIAGGLFNGIWKLGILILCLLILSLVPGKILGREDIQPDIMRSRIMTLAHQQFLSKHPLAKQTIKTALILKNPKFLKEFMETQEFTRFIQHPKVVAIQDDALIKRKAKEKDFLILLYHPRVKAALHSQEVRVNFTDLAKRIFEEQAQKEKEKQ